MEIRQKTGKSMHQRKSAGVKKWLFYIGRPKNPKSASFAKKIHTFFVREAIFTYSNSRLVK